MAIGLGLPTEKRRKQQQSSSPSNNNNNQNKHKCKIRLKDPNVKLPDYEIELYWKKESQWWDLDKKTTLHNFRYTSDDKGVCVASWLSRKNVKCKWRKVCEDNSYSDEEESESSEEESKAPPPVVSPLKDDHTERESSDGDGGDASSLSSDSGMLNLNETVWWDGEDSDLTDDDDDYDDEDYEPQHAFKKQRCTKPCDIKDAMFGKIKIIKGGVYQRRVGGGDVWLVKVSEFTGRNHARVQVIYYLHAAIHDCFPHADNDCIRKDRRTVFNESIRGKSFLGSLEHSDEDFNLHNNLVVFDLYHDKKEKVIFELKRRSLQESSYSTKKDCTSKPKELVLFAGIGGCSLGDKEAGFDVKWLVENNHLAAASLQKNHNDATIYEEKVELFLSKCEEGKEGYPSKGDVEHLQSSPPCKGFSRANTTGGQSKRRKNNLMSMQTIRGTHILRPETGMIENVTGLLDPRHVHYAISILQGLTDLDYQVRIAIHNSCHFGVAQKRQRVIITFSRKDISLPAMPTPVRHKGCFVTLRDAIEDLEHVPCDITGSGLVRLSNDRFTFNHVASQQRKSSQTLPYDEPVNTMTTNNTFFHPIRSHRTLSIRELARVFGLQDSIQFFGSVTAMQKQIGNSVPVKLATAIAKPILAVHAKTRTMHGYESEDY